MENGNRTQSVDIAKGILIILVVVAHAQADIVHDIIFIFHMPLFFVISGFLIRQEKLLKTGYVRGKIKHLIIPYMIYLMLDMLLVRKTLSVHDWMYALWGGRAVTGVYWYITCFLFTLFLLSTLLKKFSDRTIKSIALIGGGISVIESHLIDKIHLLQSPGVPWNLDVSLMALIYLSIGFFYKDKIKQLSEFESRKYDLAALIPCAFGMVFARIIYWMEKINWLDGLNRFFALCGQATIPIMFMHIPLNHWKDAFEYGRVMYVVIGIGIPIVFTLIFNKYKAMRKLFGLPKL